MFLHHRHYRKIAVRKVLRARRALRTLYTVVAVSTAMSAIGIIIYLAIYPSSIVLMEAFVWLIEALSFLGLMIAFRIASSKALAYRARYEFLRLEALASLGIALTGIVLTEIVVYRSVWSGGKHVTPMVLALYPLSSSLVSFILERRTSSTLRRIGARLVAVSTVAKKLALDVAMEAAGGVSIIASNILGTGIIEVAAVVATSVYVVYGLIGIAYESVLYLLGVGPSSVISHTRRSVERIVRRAVGRRPTRLRVETFGTFSEVEVWVEAPPYISLETAYRRSMMIAREIVKQVPEVIRAIVILTPWSQVQHRRRPPSLRGFVGIKRSRRQQQLPQIEAPGNTSTSTSTEKPAQSGQGDTSGEAK